MLSSSTRFHTLCSRLLLFLVLRQVLAEGILEDSLDLIRYALLTQISKCLSRNGEALLCSLAIVAIGSLKVGGELII